MKTFIKNKSRWLATAATVAVVAGVLWAIFGKASHSNSTALRVAKYSVEFAESLGTDAPHYADSIKVALAAPQHETDSATYKRLRAFGRSLFENGLQTQAFEYLKKCIEIVERNPSPSDIDEGFQSSCYLLLGAAADEVGLRSMSQDYYFTGLKLADKSQPGLAGDFFNNIGVSYLRTGKTDKAAEYYNKALEISLTRPDRYLTYIVYTNLAEVAAMEKDFDKAIGYALKAIQCVDEVKQPNEYYSTQTVIGQLYAYKNEPGMALTYLNNAYSNQKKGNNPYYLFDTCMALASVYADKQDTDSTAQYLKHAERIAEETDNPDQRSRVLAKQAEEAMKKGNPLLAYNLQTEILTLKDSIYREENAARIEQAHNIYNIESNARNTGISSWNPVAVFTYMAVLVGALVVFIVCILAMKRKESIAVAERARAIDELNELQRMQLSEGKATQERIKANLELHERKLASFTLDRIQTGQQIEAATTRLKQIILDSPTRDKQLRDSLKEVVAQLASLKTDSQWEEFQYFFERVHPDFYMNLDERHPGLTQKDRRLCALLSLGLSTKDIAAITFREVRSVESSRNRLRKKLALDANSNLSEYILSLSRHNNM